MIRALLAALILVTAAACSRDEPPDGSITASSPTPKTKTKTTTSAKAKSEKLEVIATGDIGGATDQCGCRTRPIGGLARRVARVKKEDEAHPDAVLVVDSGDAFFAEPLVRFRDEAEAKATAELQADAMRHMDVVAMAVGDRDLALGVPYLKRTAERAGVALVAANLAIAKTGTPAFSRYIVVERAGRKIGIVGAALEPDPRSEAQAAYQRAGVTAFPADAFISDAARDAKKDGAEIVIALLHTGLVRARSLIEGLAPNLVDVAIVSHDRALSPLEALGAAKKTVLVMPGDRGKALRILTIDGDAPVKDATEPLAPSLPLDEQTRLLEAAYRDAMKKLDKEAAGLRYAGSSGCKKCHAKEYAQWKTTKHAKAGASLDPSRQSDNADCRTCHSTYADERDVGCESCHGAARDHAGAPELLLRVGRVVPERVCWDCHRPAADQKPFFFENRILLVRHL